MTAPNESKKPLSVSHLGLSDKSSKIESASAESRSYVLPTSTAPTAIENIITARTADAPFPVKIPYCIIRKILIIPAIQSGILNFLSKRNKPQPKIER